MYLRPFYVLRRPLLPIGVYVEVQRRLAQGHELIDILRDSYQQHPAAQQALYFASGEVHRQCQQWLSGTLVPSDKLLKTLYRYLVRMSTRATPFGLFAGISVGEWGAQSAVRFDDALPPRTHCRLDATAMQQLWQYVSQLPAVQPTVLYRANSTTYPVGPELRYVEADWQAGLPSRYSLSATATSEYLIHILTAARNGATLHELTAALTAGGIDAGDAANYVDNLIDNQLLLSEYGLALTTHDELGRLLDRLRPITGLASVIDWLTQLQATLPGPDKPPICSAPEPGWLPPIDIGDRPLLQGDTYFPALQNSLGESVRQQLSRTLQKLLCLNASVPTYLTTFQHRFYERYEEQEIPLLVALDPDVGVGYGDSSLAATLLDGLNWPGQSADELAFTKAHRAMLRLFTQALQAGKAYIDLSDADLDDLAQASPPLPASGYWLGYLLADSAQAIDAGNWHFQLVGGGGPSAANLLGRMAHLDDRLAGHLRACLEQEEESEAGAVWAEIVHLPEAHLANVLTRPVLRDYEIPILSVSGVDEAHQLPLDDLLVSVPQGRRIVLRSRRLGKRVIPRLSTAHNFSTGLAHYRFLCDLQHQAGTLHLNWNWGSLASQPYLPQVRYQHVILSRAAWQLTSDMAQTGQPHWIAAWRTRFHVPRYVVIANADNELPLDLDNAVNVALLTDELRKTGLVTLKEWLLNEQSCWAGAGASRWVSELILPASFAVTPESVPAAVGQAVSVQRLFAPGSEWVYLKISCGEQAAEQWLLNELPPLLQKLRAEGHLRQWFYVRYNQPEPQLRVRFQSEPGHESPLLLQVVNWMQALTAAHGLLYRIQLDTYQREVERYGADRIELCEAWFCLESELLLTLLPKISEEGEIRRLFYACALVDQLFKAWQLSLAQRQALIEHLRDTFSREFQADTPLLVQLDQRYRLHRSVVHEGLTTANLSTELIRDAPLFRQLANQLQRTQLSPPQHNALLASLIHMRLNRLFPTENRRHEYLVYHLLKKEYASLLKRTPPPRT